MKFENNLHISLKPSYPGANLWRIAMGVGHYAVIKCNSESGAKEEIKKFASARSTFFP